MIHLRRTATRDQSRGRKPTDTGDTPFVTGLAPGALTQRRSSILRKRHAQFLVKVSIGRSARARYRLGFHSTRGSGSKLKVDERRAGSADYGEGEQAGGDDAGLQRGRKSGEQVAEFSKPSPRRPFHCDRDC